MHARHIFIIPRRDENLNGEPPCRLNRPVLAEVTQHRKPTGGCLFETGQTLFGAEVFGWARVLKRTLRTFGVLWASQNRRDHAVSDTAQRRLRNGRPLQPAFDGCMLPLFHGSSLPAEGRFHAGPAGAHNLAALISAC